MSIKSQVRQLIFGNNNIGAQNEIARIEWVKQVLSQLPCGSRILDAGAGEQSYRQFCEHLQYVAQDFAEYDGKGNKIGLQTGSWNYTKLDIVSDITAIPEPDESFDAILCTEVFEHLPNPILAIREFARLLQPGGSLILTAPFCSLTHFAPYHFYTGFNRYFYETHLPTYGFEIIELVENGNYFEYLAQEIRRIPSVSQQYAKCRPNMLEKLAMEVILSMLQKFSRADAQSAQLLNFGEHVHARKSPRR